MPLIKMNFKLSHRLKKVLTSSAKRLRLKKSEIVRMAVERFMKGPRPYEKVSCLIGVVSSGVPDLGSAHREYLGHIRNSSNRAQQ